MNRKPNHFLFFLAALCTLLLTSCTPGQEAVPGGVRAWIDIPRDRSVISLTPHQVIAHASDAAGIQQVELLENGAAVGLMSCDNPAKPLVTCSATWNPPAAGDYRLEVRATNPLGGVGLSAPVNVKIGKTTVTMEPEMDVTNMLSEVPSLTPSGTLLVNSPTPTSTPSTQTPTGTTPSPKCSGPPSIPSFTASPATISSGESTTLSWGAVLNADSVSIDQGVGGVATPGTRLVSPNNTTTFTMTASGCGGTITSQVIVTVKAALPTDSPKPPPDTLGPPAPEIVLPANDAILSCSQNVKLTWTAPPDPSGIARYRVRLQVTSKVNPSDQDWSDVKIWDPVTTTQVTANEETTCGGFYRWRVVGYDGAGNQGNVSAWARFGIALP